MGRKVVVVIRTSKGLALSLVIPIVVLGALVFYKRHILNEGIEVILAVEGYDPRDLLSGHYLTYTVKYEVEGLCVGIYDPTEHYVCLETKTSSSEEPVGCRLYIRGYCQTGRFVAGIERYYVDEKLASELEKKVRDRKASVVLSVTRSGHAQVKDLLIDGRPWREQQ